MKKIPHNTKAFVSLFAVLLATVILAMAIGMSSVALKQIVLSSNANEANQAFYAADSALQCAIALDGINVFQAGFEGVVDCGTGQDIPVDNSNDEVFRFGENSQGFEWSSGCCVRVEVDKTGETTKIEALGYNVACDQIDQSPRVVERALRVRYGG